MSACMIRSGASYLHDPTYTETSSFKNLEHLNGDVGMKIDEPKVSIYPLFSIQWIYLERFALFLNTGESIFALYNWIITGVKFIGGPP